MTAILLALGAAVSWGISDFTGGFLTRKLPIGAVLLISQAVGFAMLALLAALGGPPSLDLRTVVLAAAASATGLVGIGALYRGMAVGVVSIVAPISATGAALPVLFGVLRGERATLLQAVGIGLALIGIILASRSSDDSSTSRGSVVARGVGLAILAAAGFGVFFIFLHEASAGANVLWVGAVQRLSGVVFVAVLVVAMRSSVAVGWQRAPGIAVVGVLDTTANVLYASASTMGLVSVAAVLASLYPVVTVILARIVLHERLSLIQTVGVVCALAGVAFIALT
jgi:drug/metabolite transporter (DMT)-like permease